MSRQEARRSGEADKVEQTLYWPEAMLEEMAAQAARLDTSVSWCMQKAWLLARAKLRALEPNGVDAKAEATYRARYVANPKAAPKLQRATLYFPPAMLDAITAEARRQDRSLSWLLQRAWCLSATKIQKLSSTVS